MVDFKYINLMYKLTIFYFILEKRNNLGYNIKYIIILTSKKYLYAFYYKVFER